MIQRKSIIRKQRISQEKGNRGFRCSHCGTWVIISKFIGTAHRNHCPHCLWSKHVDQERAGDRRSECGAEMRPLGLTFKKEAIHIYAKRKEGELMLIHECSQCRKISLNRISGDDSSEEILSLFELSREISSEKGKELEKRGIYVCKEKDREEITAQLFGNKGSFAA